MLAFRRPNGWTVITNFGTEPFALPAGASPTLSSIPTGGDVVPGETTVWISGA
ncbi:hypothetical protein D3C71_2247370 [compost metagenome]